VSLTVLDSAHGADHGYESLPKDGSGTNEQDMGNSESQSVLKMRSLSCPADGKAGRIRLPTPIHQRAARGS